MIGIGGEHAFEVFERLSRPAKFEERHAAPVEKLGIIGRERRPSS